jgi:hypothetical protein
VEKLNLQILEPEDPSSLTKGPRLHRKGEMSREECVQLIGRLLGLVQESPGLVQPGGSKMVVGIVVVVHVVIWVGRN